MAVVNAGQCDQAQVTGDMQKEKKHRTLLCERQTAPLIEDEERRMKIIKGRALLKSRQPLPAIDEEERRRKIQYGRALFRSRQDPPLNEDEERRKKILHGRALLTSRKPLPLTEEDERRRKIVSGRALFAKYQQRKAQRDWKIKINVSKCKQDQHNLESAGNPNSTKTTARQIQKQNKIFDKLAEFEAALKHKDFIITQLIDKLQQANREKEATTEQFAKLTEQTKNLQNGFQHIMQLKLDLEQKYMIQMEDLKSRHKREMEETLHRCATLYGEREQFLHATVNELHMELQYTHYHNNILWDELQAAKLENCALHYKCENLSKQSRSLQDQIMRLKLDLEQKYMIQMEDLKSRHKREMEETLHRCANLYGEREQFLQATVKELNTKLQYTHYHNKKLMDELQAAKLEKCALHYKSESPSIQSRSLKDQLSGAEQRVSGLQYGAEQTNYKVKLEMVEKKENDTVLYNKTESKGDELNGLRTQLLNHEEELSKLKGDLEVEHRSNTENLIKKPVSLRARVQDWLVGLVRRWNGKADFEKEENPH